MTAIYYDTEFIEDGRTIDLISIGLIAENGDKLYRVSSEFDRRAVAAHSWLMANVVPSLPFKPHYLPGTGRHTLSPDPSHPDYRDVHGRRRIANDVAEFILSFAQPELWAWYAAYDHVALCQLWGPMADLPRGIPMWTRDFKQDVEAYGNPRLPDLPGLVEHHALADARELKYRREWLMRSSTVVYP